MAKRKLERLDTASVEKRIELTRLLDDFQQLVEVNARLTERIEDLTAQLRASKPRRSSQPLRRQGREKVDASPVSW